MRSSASHILETALALRRLPGERFRLLGQPLPADITYVVEIASGAPQALHDAASELGESDAIVLEAARFYIEQMLFAAPDADAYRILGVSPVAEHELIRLHHRLLQRWLHPDRALAGDASIFATRVNQAWSHLRTPALRDEYDAGRRNARQDVPAAVAPTAGRFRWDYDHDSALPRHGRRSRWLFGAALVCSLVLAVLIVRHGDDADAVVPWDEVAPAAGAGLAVPAMQAPDAAGDISALGNALVSRAQPSPAREAAIPPAAAPASATEPPAAARPEAASLAASVDARRVLLASEAPESEARPAMRMLPKVVPVSRQPVRVAVMATTESSSIPVKSATVSRSAPAAAPAMIAAVDVVPPMPPSIPSTNAASDGAPAVLLDRMRKAEQRVAQVAAYLSESPGAAPLWNDVQTQAEADRLKQWLAVRKGSSLHLVAPDWQLRPADASYNGTYRCEGCGSDPVRLKVQLVWREGLWLVRGVGLGPSA